MKENLLHKCSIIAAYLLDYSDILDYVYDYKYYTVGVNSYCLLYCDIHNKWDYIKIKRSLKYEHGFVSICTTEKRFAIKFKVDEKYKNILPLLNTERYSVFNSANIVILLKLLKKKSPAAQKSSRALFFNSLLQILYFLYKGVLL